MFMEALDSIPILITIMEYQPCNTLGNLMVPEAQGYAALHMSAARAAVGVVVPKLVHLSQTRYASYVTFALSLDLKPAGPERM